MAYTLGQAAKAVGRTKPTLSRAIRSGKLSATRNPDGSFSIDPAELARAYPPVASEPTVTLQRSDPGGVPGALQRENALLLDRIAELQATVADLRAERDQLLRALLDREPRRLAGPGWWRRIFGGGG